MQPLSLGNFLLLLAGAAFLWGCSKDPVVQPVVDRIEISGPNTLLKYHEAELQATAYLTDGTVANHVTITWQSSNPAVASVNSNGKVTGINTGTANITATAAGVTTGIEMQITENPVTDIQISVPDQTVISKVIPLQATIMVGSGLTLNGSSLVNWSVTGPARITGNSLLATDSGNVNITATAGAVSRQKTVYVKAWEETEIDPYLAQPAAGAIRVVSVVIIRILPTADGVNIDATQDVQYGGGGEISIADMKKRLLRFDKRIKFALEEGSRFRGYKTPSAVPYLGYRVVKYIDYYKPQPPNYSIITKVEAGKNVYSPHYFKMWQMFNMRDLVENQGVKEVWVWANGTAYPNFPNYDPAVHGNIPSVGGWESNMAGPYGDVSNSDRKTNDMPVYNKTYIVYQQNTRRTQAEALHNHGHQIEAQLSHINNTIFWSNFAGRSSGASPPYGRAGDTHFPPNATADYDYINTTPVLSDIEDWTPNAIGEKKLVNRDTWGSIPYNWPEADGLEQKVESQWYIYWWQNIPGYQNNISWSATHKMSNWWEFVADWDAAKAAGKNLNQPK